MPRLTPLTRILFIVLAIPTVFVNAVVGQTTAARPDRGVNPGGSYAVSDIENINLQNGNVNLSIPLASLPPIAGGKLGWTINATYNSKLWNMLRKEHEGAALPYRTYVVDTPSLSDAGGWQVGGAYALFIRNAKEDFDYAMPPYPESGGGSELAEYQRLQYNWCKVVLRTPDGAEHELRPTGNHQMYGGVDYPRTYLWGYFKDTPDTTGVPMQYYATDGTFLSAIVNPNGHASGIQWTVFLPDGTQVIRYANNIERIRDNNGNTIKIFEDGNGTHYQDEQTGRELRVTTTTQANGYPQTQVWYQTVTGVSEHIDVNFGETIVKGKVYKIHDWNPVGQSETGAPGVECIHHAELPPTSLPVVREIVLPSTESNQPQKRFTFQYGSDQTETASTPGVFFLCGETVQTYSRQASVGMGALSQIVTPNGATVDYSYTLDGTHAFIDLEGSDKMIRDTLATKTLVHDGATDLWTYHVPTTSMSTNSWVENPDGSTSHQDYFAIDPGFALMIGNDEPRAGLVYHSSDGVTETYRHWSMRGVQIASGSNHSNAINTFVDAEYTSYVGTNLMSAKTFQYDYNGNLTQVKEYDWRDASGIARDGWGVPTAVPAGATLLRETNTSYYNSAADASAANYYQTRALTSGVPSVLNATKETTIGPSITRFSYDYQVYGVAPTLGNLTSQSVWDNLDNKWISSSQTYGAYGNLDTKTDPLQHVTHFFYNDSTHAKPTSVVVENGTEPQTFSTTYDYSTGQTTSTTDQNNQTTTIDYNNPLLGAVDPFGRPGVVISPAVIVNGSPKHHLVTTTYYDSTRQVLAAADLVGEGDKLLKTLTTSDMLGQPIVTSQNEDGTTNYTIFAKTAYSKMGKVTYSSMPMRSGSAATDSWARATRDTVGRVKEVATFGGATPPPEGGTNSNWSGNVNTTYDRNFTTVTDQAGKVRRSMTDALGRLVRVDEPDANGNLDVNGVPYQSTSYSYDVLGNLIGVTQGSQTRTFVYDSLLRLRSASNPESGTVTYTYDDDGNLQTKTDARGVVATYAYDALNRSTSVSYTNDPTNTPTVTRTYDGATNGKGKLWQTETSGATGSRTTINNYDALGRPTSQSQQFKVSGAWSAAFTLSVAYGLSGQVLQQTYPSGHTVNYTYDNAGRISSFNGNLGEGVPRTYANDFLYTASGAVQQERFGTDVALYHKQRYSQTGQLWDMRLSTKCFAMNTGYNNCSADPADGDRGAIVNYYSNNFVQGGTGADNNGNLLRQEISVPGSGFFQDNFNYDSLNRLTSISEKLNGTGSDTFKQSYHYDRWGNRTIDLGTTNGQPNTTTNVPHPDFTVTTTNNRLGVPSGQSGTMTYDAAGNLTVDTYSGAAVSRAYDAENRMTSETQANSYDAGTYTYDGDGRRVRRKVGSTETWQSYGLSGELLAEYAKETAASNPQKEYGYRNGQLLIIAEAANPRTNVALATNGATASASSILSSSFVASGAINGDRKGVNWGNGGGWADASSGTFPDWLEVDFNGSKTIDEIDVFTIQDNWSSPSEPTEAMTFSTYGQSGYDVQYWNGSSWVTVSGGSITGNNKVWKKLSFTAVTTSKIRVLTNASIDNGYSHLTEVEAWSPAATSTAVDVAASASGASASASSVYTPSSGTYYNAAPGVTIDGERSGKVGNATYWWNDWTQNSGPDWLQVDFNGSQTIAEIDVFTGQDDYLNAVAPTETMTCSSLGLTGYDVQYWNGSSWVTVPGGSVTGNNLVWRKFSFTAITTSKIRVLTSASPDGWSRITEVEAWTGSSGSTAKINWLVTDQLGTPRISVDRTGTLTGVSRHDYLPFGEDLTVARSATPGYSTPDNVRQKFTKKERDNETELDYFGARYYGTSQGRFTSPDPLLSSGEISQPQSWNRYSYTLNNPLVFTDPFGLFIFQKDVTEDERNQFEAALEQAHTDLATIAGTYGIESDQYKAAKSALDVYGEEGVDNGVMIVSKDGRGDARTRTDRGVGSVTADNPTGKRTVIEFDKAAFTNASLSGLIGHEGSHAADDAKWASGGFQKGKRPDPYQTEVDAYTVQSLLFEAEYPNNISPSFLLPGASAGPGRNPFIPEPIYLYSASWAEADKATRRRSNIDSYLARPTDKGGNYGLIPPRKKARN